jgi:16S rRNA (guanine966-N2)-methyltransferase
MRIISGRSKGRRLATPKSLSLRPTSDRVKESVFNILGDEVEGTAVLDLFAGTGNLGIEALSRGAKKAVFVEKERDALGLIEKNIGLCGTEERSEVIQKDAIEAIKFLHRRGESFDLIFMDPPYEKGLIERTLSALRDFQIDHEGSMLVIEHNRREPLPETVSKWTVVRERRMGDTVVSFLTC